MKVRLCCLLAVLIGGLGFSQREAANWYFGKNAGLDFNSGTPEPLFDGMINTVEGCEAFSDSGGNLLFYTDGKTVWNRAHNVMPNGLGLKGSFSTSQSALVVPNPTNPNIYYVFTPDDALSQRESGATNGFNYSVVDMSLDAFRGDVSEKNIKLLPQGSEKVSAVKNSKGNFYWVVTQFRDQFYAYRVDGNGVDTQPVVSRVGPWIQDFENTRGNLKISPDGTKLAISHTIVVPEFEGSFYLFDFNAETGVVSNPELVSDSRIYYGVEFSSNSSKLYGTGIDLLKLGDSTRLGAINIVQYDLDEPDFRNSEYLVASLPNKSNVFVAGTLQIAIDKKIYHAVPNDHLSVIRTPNLKGINVDFRGFAISLGDRLATYGLPPFVQSFFETIVTIENFCEGSKTTFTTDSTGDVASIAWNFGDPSTGLSNFSTDMNPSHIFSSHGTYTVTLNVEYTDGSSRQFIEFVEIAESPNVADEVVLVQCDIDGVDDGITTFNLKEAIPLFNNGNPDITALYFTNEANARANTNQLDPEEFRNAFDGQEIYARAFENAECATIVKITLVTQPMSDLGTYDTVYICNAVQAPLGANVDATEVYEWLRPDFETYDSISLYRTREEALFEREELPLELFWFGIFDPYPYELYFRVESSNECAFIGKVILNLSEKPDFESNRTINLCKGEARLEAPEGYETYLWSKGGGSDELVVNQTGLVDVVFGNGPCTYVQTFEVLPERQIDIAEIEIEIDDFNKNNTLRVLIGAGEESSDIMYSVDGGINFQVSSTFSRLTPGLYDLVVDNGCSTYEKEVLVGGMPTFFTPNSDGMHESMSLLNEEFFPNYSMSIFDRYGKLLKTITEKQEGWDGTYLNEQMPADDYWYVLELADGRTVKGYFTLKR